MTVIGSNNNKNKQLGIVGVLVLGVAMAKLAACWHSKESLLYNLVTLLVVPLAFSDFDAILNVPLEDQVAHLAARTRHMEWAASSRLGVWWMGHDFYQASFGSTATRLVEWHVPSNGNDNDNDNDYAIPITCAAPSTMKDESNNNQNNDGLPLVLYFYSGGLIMGSVQSELPLMRWIAHQAHVVVCGIHYRKAPQYPYPIPIQDAVQGSLGLLTLPRLQLTALEQQLGTNINRQRVATWGMSAGGYLSAHVARQLTLEHNFSNVVIKCQLSLIPMAKPHSGTHSMLQHWNGIMWTGPKNAFAWAVFLPGDDGRWAADWRVSLLMDPPQTQNNDIANPLDKLPPAYIQIHTQDILRDEGEMYAKRLEQQGKLIALDEYDTSHVGGMPILSRGGPAQGSLVRALDVLQEYLLAS